MMSTEEQKDFGHLLFRMQNGLCLTIGPFSELNYEMATDVSIVRLFNILLVWNLHLNLHLNRFISVNKAYLSVFDAFDSIYKLNRWNVHNFIGFVFA